MICPHCKGLIPKNIDHCIKGGRVRSLAKARAARENGLRRTMNEKTMTPKQIREILPCYGKDYDTELLQCVKRCAFRFSCKKRMWDSMERLG